MAKNILVIEDNCHIYYEIENDLMVYGYEVFCAYQISDAIDILESKRIDFIITDLNIPPIGLTIAEIDETYSGQIAGWVLLKNYAFTIDKKLRNRAIIFSDFTNILYNNIPSKDLNGIKIFKKGKDSIKDIIDYIKTYKFD
jgi:CheY-like chemotaxis protein